MSESSEHRNLVIAMSNHISINFPEYIVTTDIQAHPGDLTPEIINGYRPDIIAKNSNLKFFIIGEAKTAQDLENAHSNNQLRAFSCFLEREKFGILLLGISAEKANRAKTLLRFLYWELNISQTKFKIFDGLDFWTLHTKDENKWLLD